MELFLCSITSLCDAFDKKFDCENCIQMSIFNLNKKLKWRYIKFVAYHYLFWNIIGIVEINLKIKKKEKINRYPIEHLRTWRRYSSLSLDDTIKQFGLVKN